jgi:uncharacterized protein (TIGR03086 family)
MKLYIRGQDQFEDILRSVRPDQWDSPSPCTGWTARDLAGHVIWGLDMISSIAAGQKFGNRMGAPGASRPADYLGSDPLADWCAKREVCMAALTPDALERTARFGPLGEVPLAEFLSGLAVDFAAHTWDLSTAVGGDVRLDPELVEHGLRWAETSAHLLRTPAGLGPALPVPDDASPQTRLLRELGRPA